MNDYEKFESFLNMHKYFSWEMIMTHSLTKDIWTTTLCQWLRNFTDVGHISDKGKYGFVRNRTF